MGFFKDFKDDFSEAVGELMPDDDDLGEKDEFDALSDELDTDIDIEKEMKKIDSLLSDVSTGFDADEKEDKFDADQYTVAKKEPGMPELEFPKFEIPGLNAPSAGMNQPETEKKEEENAAPAAPEAAFDSVNVTEIKELEDISTENKIEDIEKTTDEKAEEKSDAVGADPVTAESALASAVSGADLNVSETVVRPIESVSAPEVRPKSALETLMRKEKPAAPQPAMKSDPVIKEAAGGNIPVREPVIIKKTEVSKMDTMESITSAEDYTPSQRGSSVTDELDSAVRTDENTIITSGTRINGNVDSTGSLEIQGNVHGDVKCNGKLTITGVLIGNSSSAEFFADTSKIEGEVMSTGTVKIGMGSVIIGNITATSAVIAGAVKGDIDVQGPVVIDSSAVIVGNIKSKSVQINNGAVIEGFCSQCYSDIDMDSLFEKEK